VQETQEELETHLMLMVVVAEVVQEDREEIIPHQEQQVLVEQELNYHQLLEIHSPNQMQQQVVD
jgi:hypothetical protein